MGGLDLRLAAGLTHQVWQQDVVHEADVEAHVGDILQRPQDGLPGLVAVERSQVVMMAVGAEGRHDRLGLQQQLAVEVVSQRKH